MRELNWKSIIVSVVAFVELFVEWDLRFLQVPATEAPSQKMEDWHAAVFLQLKEGEVVGLSVVYILVPAVSQFLRKDTRFVVEPGGWVWTEVRCVQNRMDWSKRSGKNSLYKSRGVGLGVISQARPGVSRPFTYCLKGSNNLCHSFG